MRESDAHKLTSRYDVDEPILFNNEIESTYFEFLTGTRNNLPAIETVNSILEANHVLLVSDRLTTTVWERLQAKRKGNKKR